MTFKSILAAMIFTILPHLTYADTLPDLVRIEVTVTSQQMIEGKLKSEVLAKPKITTQMGDDGIIKIVSKFPIEVPDHEEMTNQMGESGVIMSVLPNYADTHILLKGVVQIPQVACIQSLEEKGSIAVLESRNILFSLKVMENKPFELTPIDMPDGSKLILTFLTSRPAHSELKRSSKDLGFN